jgi:hypothetical protein
MDSALPPLSNAKSNRTRQHIAGAAALILLLIFAAWLRTAHFDESLWLDELHTSWTVHDSLAEVAPRAAMGNQPPLPYWLWWAWVQLVGESEFTLRFPSLVASLAAIAILFCAVLRWTGSYLAALTAAALLTFEPLSLFYGGEARVYAWLQAMGLLHLALLVHLMKRPMPKLRALWVGLGIVLIYTHYTAAMFVGSAFAVAIIYARVRQSGTMYLARAVLIDGAITALALLPAIPSLRTIVARRHNWAQFVELPSFDTLHELVGYPQALGLAALAGVASWGLTKLHRQQPSKLDTLAANDAQVFILPAVILWITLPLVVSIVFTYLDVARLFFPRYLVTATMGTPTVIGLLVGSLSTHKARVGAALVLLTAGLLEVGAVDTFALTETPRTSYVPARNEDWRGAIAAINQELERDPDSVVVMAVGLIEVDRASLEGDERLREFASFPAKAIYKLETNKTLPAANHAKEIAAAARRASEETRAVQVLVRGTTKQQKDVDSALRKRKHPDEFWVVHPRSLDGILLWRVYARWPGWPT